MTAKVIHATDLLVSNRTSIAGTLQDELLVDVPAHTPRLQTVTAVTLPALTKRSGASPIVQAFSTVDPIRNVCFLQPTYTTLWTIDATSEDESPTQTKVLDADVSFPGYGVYAVAVTDNAWFVAIGHTYGAVPDGETVQCMIVKCTNFVTPSWSIVHTNLYGCPADIGMIGSGARVAYGVYKNFDLNLGAGGQNIYKCGVYVSDDEGATWETAAEIPATILSGSDYHVLWHAHGIAFDPNDEDKLYVTMGDYASAGGPPYFHSLSRTTPGVWTDTALFRSQLAGLIYFNGEWYGGQHTLNLFDVTTGRKSEVFSPAGVSDAPTTYPYSERQDVSTIQSFASYGGVLYAGYQKFVMLPGYEALLVSVNGRDWSCIARNPGTYGYQHVLGYAGGKMWAESVDGAGNAALYSFDPVAAAEVEALRIERPRTNLLTTRQDTTFVLTNGTGNLGSWVVSGNHNPTSGPDVLATSSADADKCLHFTSATNDEWTAINSGALVGAFGSTLSNGDYFAVSARCWSPNSNYRFAIGLYPHPATNITCDRDTHRVLLSATPKRIWLLGKCTGAIDNSLYLKVYVFGYSGTEIIDVYMDQFAWYKSATEWPLWDEWQRGDVPRTAETVCLPLGGLPAGGYTICWDWLGGMSELMTADHPILTLEADDGSYLEVSWIASTSKVQLSNGDATATMATALTRLREDVIRFVLVYDSAVGHTLTIVDPVNGQQSCTANFHDAFSTTNPPRHCLIGESLDGIAEQGHGLFWNLVRYDHALTAGEITTHLAAGGVGLLAGDGLPAAANVLEDVDRGDGTAGSLVLPTTPTADDIADAVLDQVDGIETGVTMRQSLRVIAAVLAGKVSGAGSGVESFTGLDGATPRVVVTADDNGNRSDVTYTAD